MPAVQNFSICAALAVFLDFCLQVCKAACRSYVGSPVVESSALGNAFKAFS